jgi:hypothetical protein
MRVLKCEEPNPELDQRLSQIFLNPLNHNQGFVQIKKKLELGLEGLLESKNQTTVVLTSGRRIE